MKPKLLIITVIIISSLLSLNFLENSKEKKMTAFYLDKSLNIEDRVEDLLKRMTFEEKIDMLGGTGFETKAIERLGIPPLNMTDGPLGVRWDNSTALPSGILMGATWNPELISKLGTVLATEVKAKGRHVILAPCVNIARIPMGGRNFESFGEDPFLTSRIAVDYIKGVQKENVVATVKHFAANNQEHQRDFVNTIVDERALNEIYLPSFKAAVEEANVLAVMSAYNKLNGHYCSENDYLLIDKLKTEWKFKGLVMSDWGAVHSTVPTFNGGLDLEMPTGKYLNKETLLDKIKSGELSEAKLDDKVRRILRVMFTIGLFDDYQYDKSKVNTDEHKQVALDVAKDGIVLLKNNNSILPLELNKIKSIAVIGSNSNVAVTGGGGSSMVVPFESVSPLEALRNKIGNKVKINFAQGSMIDGDANPIDPKYLFVDIDQKENGLKGEYFTNMNLNGKPERIVIDKTINFMWNDKGPFEDFPQDNFSVRWNGYIKVDQSGRYTLDVASDDGVRFYFDDKLVIDDWNDHALLTNSYTVNLEANKFYKIKLEYYENGGGAIVKFGWRKPNDELIVDAINAAKNSDVAIVFAGTNYTYESEGYDRKDLSLPNEQDELINQIAAANKNTIVVLTTGSPVLMDKWIDKVDGLIEAWFAGEQAGNAIAEILLGEANPSGKLPITFPKRWEDCSAFNTYKKEDGTTRYEDGIYVGYRHFEKNKIEPLFPFGYGLSYTTFEYSGINLSSKEIDNNDKLTISLKLKNTGRSKGSEVVQLYINDLQSSVDRPVKELKAFKKVSLNPGEEKVVELTIDQNALSFFDTHKKMWIAEPGKFEVLIGSSSKDIKLKDTFNLK
ncbi:MAG TPA: glycoside hydrolase family 3 C-terminal domain-containing protein [Ignavibacteriaceae bacterium]|nr:glycoside hydrolase family 3 C-terminal domain-containing protein [Ignavibacteriaceae bacterium]